MVARALTSDIGAEEITRIVVQQGMAGMDASGGALLFLDGDHVRTVVAFGSTTRSIRQLQWQDGYGSMALGRNNPICQSIRDTEEIWIADRDEGLRRFPDLGKASSRSHGWAALPLLSQGRPFGAFSLSFASPPTFGDADRDYVRTLTDIAALALSRIFEAAQTGFRQRGPEILIDEVTTAMLAATTDGIVAVDGAGTIVQCNDRLCELLGYRPDRIVGRSIEVLLPHDRREEHVRHRQRYVDDPVPRSEGSGLDLVALRADGTELAVEVTLSPCVTRIGLCTIAVVRPRP